MKFHSEFSVSQPATCAEMVGKCEIQLGRIQKTLFSEGGGGWWKVKGSEISWLFSNLLFQERNIPGFGLIHDNGSTFTLHED